MSESNNKKQIPLKTILSFLEKWAPLHYAQSFDHPGLQIGDRSQPISSILVVVDIDQAILNYLQEQSVDLIITHHPLLFQAISAIDFKTDIGQIIRQLILKNTALYSMHTNLDIAPGGVNDCLIEAFGFDPQIGKMLRPQPVSTWYKIAVYIPADALAPFQKKLFQKFSCQIGNYQHCSFSTNGEGSFEPLTGADPSIGTIGIPEKVAESKLEFMLSKEDLSPCLDFIRKEHPYEEPAIDVFEQKMVFQKMSMSKYFKPKNGVPFQKLANQFPCRVRGAVPNETIKTIAFGCGSGKYLITDLIQSEIEVFITGEMDYHSALSCELNGITVIELGHKESESFVLTKIQNRLLTHFPSLTISVK